MTFNLTLSGTDLLLLVPEMLLTVWLCVVLIVDFAMPRLPKEPKWERSFRTWAEVIPPRTARSSLETVRLPAASNSSRKRR